MGELAIAKVPGIKPGTLQCYSVPMKYMPFESVVNEMVTYLIQGGFDSERSW